MSNLEDLTSEQILKIPEDSPEKIFTKDNWKAESRLLFGIWHTDRNDHLDAAAVFTRIRTLAKKAEEKIKAGTWNGPAHILVDTSDGKKFRLSYRKMHEFELGRMYIGYKQVFYTIEEQYEDLFDNAVDILTKFKFPDKKLEKDFGLYIPKIIKAAKNTNFGHLLVLEKESDFILLDDLLTYLNGAEFPSKQAMWVISSLTNLTCMLEICKVAHLAITPQTVFISLEKHDSRIFGGWWYARSFDATMTALPVHSIKVLPPSVFKDKKAKTVYDRYLVRALGLYILGDTSMTGSSLLKAGVIPQPILSWLRSPPHGQAITDFSNWMKMLEKGFGKRTYILWDINIYDIY